MCNAETKIVTRISLSQQVASCWKEKSLMSSQYLSRWNGCIWGHILSITNSFTHTKIILSQQWLQLWLVGIQGKIVLVVGYLVGEHQSRQHKQTCFVSSQLGGWIQCVNDGGSHCSCCHERQWKPPSPTHWIRSPSWLDTKHIVHF